MSQTPVLVSLPTPAHGAHAIDACGESAYRLNVVLRLLERHNCTDDGYDDDRPADATGGFDLSVIREELTRIRERLHEASEARP